MAIARLVVNDVVQVILRANVSSQVNLNVLHYRVTTSTGAATYFEQMDAIAAEMGTPGGVGIVGETSRLQSEDYLYDWVQTQKVGPVRSLYTRTALGAPGTVVEPCNAVNVSAVITKQTEIPGRGFSGSFHIGGLPPSAYEFGQLTNATIVQMNVICAALAADLSLLAGALRLTPVCFSQTGGIGGETNTIVNCFPQPQLRTMRRRTLGLGS